MSEPTTTTSSAQVRGVRRPLMPVAAIWLGAIALLMCLLLTVPYLALRSPVAGLFLALATAAGIAAIVLGVRARRSAPARGGWALLCALTALLIAAVMAVVFVFSMISLTSINKVELHGQGPEGSSTTFSNDREERTETWPAEGWAKFNTEGSWVELSLEAPDDASSKTVTCQIIWNGEVVVEESSTTGSVTCRYDAN